MNEHKNIITIEDEIKEFSDKPVKSSAIHKALGAMEQAMAQALEEHGVPDPSEASVGDVLQRGADGPEWGAIAQTTHIYQHHVVITASNVYILFTILSNNDVKVTTKDKFLQIFDVSSGSSSITGNESCSGKNGNSLVIGVDANGSSSVMLKLHTIGITYSDGAIALSGIADAWLNMNTCSFSDTVKTLI